MTVTHLHPSEDTDLLGLAAAIAAANVDDVAACERVEQLTGIAWDLLSRLTVATYDDITAHALLAELVAAAKATVAAGDQGACDPLVYLRHTLARHGWLPAADGTGTPRRILAAASSFGTGAA
jgi:hypothetical protein